LNIHSVWCSDLSPNKNTHGKYSIYQNNRKTYATRIQIEESHRDLKTGLCYLTNLLDYEHIKINSDG
jgi:hypothetical protein